MFPASVSCRNGQTGSAPSPPDDNCRSSRRTADRRQAEQFRSRPEGTTMRTLLALARLALLPSVVSASIAACSSHEATGDKCCSDGSNCTCFSLGCTGSVMGLPGDPNGGSTCACTQVGQNQYASASIPSCDPYPGGVCCLTSTLLTTSNGAGGCYCQDASYGSSCPAGQTQVSSCSVSLISSNGQAVCGSGGGAFVSDCSSLPDLASTGGSSSGSGTSCNSGPGTCTNPVSNNNCRNGAVCERACATCDYECLVSCTDDGPCAGFCNSDGTPTTCDLFTTGVSYCGRI
jgi:hypothetical protein